MTLTCKLCRQHFANSWAGMTRHLFDWHRVKRDALEQFNEATTPERKDGPCP